MKLSIVIPFYNEENNLPIVIDEWEKELNKYKINYKYIFINDGSTDNSLKSIKKIINTRKYYILNSKNIGAGNATLKGYIFSIRKKFDFILQIDSDGQCSPKYFKKFFYSITQKNLEYVDMTIGFRKKRLDGVMRKITSRILSILIFLRSGVYLRDANTPYRILNNKSLTRLLNIVKLNKNYTNIELKNVLITYLSKKEKFNIKWVDITFKNRYYGESKYKPIKMLLLLFNFLRFS